MVRAVEGRKKVSLQKVRCEARVQQSARRVSWGEVGQRNKTKERDVRHRWRSKFMAALPTTNCRCGAGAYTDFVWEMCGLGLAE